MKTLFGFDWCNYIIGIRDANLKSVLVSGVISFLASCLQIPGRARLLIIVFINIITASLSRFSGMRGAQRLLKESGYSLYWHRDHVSSSSNTVVTASISGCFQNQLHQMPAVYVILATVQLYRWPSSESLTGTSLKYRPTTAGRREGLPLRTLDTIRICFTPPPSRIWSFLLLLLLSLSQHNNGWCIECCDYWIASS